MGNDTRTYGGKVDLPERAFGFAKGIVGLSLILDQTPGTRRTLAGQFLRAGTSIGANLEEAQGSQSTRDFLHKLAIACKEARETNYWLRLLAECAIGPREQLQPLIQESDELIAILTTIIRKTRNNHVSEDLTDYEKGVPSTEEAIHHSPFFIHHSS